MKSLSLIFFVLSLIALFNVSQVSASNLKSKNEEAELQSPNSLAGDSITPFKSENLQEISNALVKVNFEKKLLLINEFKPFDASLTYPVTGTLDTPKANKIPEFDYNLVVVLPMARLKITFIIPAGGINSDLTSAAYIFYLFFNDSEVAANTFIVTPSSKNLAFLHPVVLEASIYNVPAKTHKISVGYKSEIQPLAFTTTSAKLILEGEALS